MIAKEIEKLTSKTIIEATQIRMYIILSKGNHSKNISAKKSLKKLNHVSQ
ncbi:hypothetical protein GW750_04560 [bacterium]|nr:hypothetical protein [bacterium]